MAETGKIHTAPEMFSLCHFLAFDGDASFRASL
jgi:hypothetical protein